MKTAMKELNESEEMKEMVSMLFTDVARVAFILDASRRVAAATIGHGGSAMNVDPKQCFDLAQRLWAEAVLRYLPDDEKGGE